MLNYRKIVYFRIWREVILDSSWLCPYYWYIYYCRWGNVSIKFCITLKMFNQSAYFFLVVTPRKGMPCWGTAGRWGFTQGAWHARFYLFSALKGGLRTLVSNQGSPEVSSYPKVTPRVENAEAGQNTADEEELFSLKTFNSALHFKKRFSS